MTVIHYEDKSSIAEADQVGTQAVSCFNSEPLEASHFRKIREVVQRIFHDIWATLGSKFIARQLHVENWKEIQKKGGELQSQGRANVPSALASLKQLSYIGSSSVIEIIESLNLPKNVGFVTEPISAQSGVNISAILSNIPESQNLTFIPVLIKGTVTELYTDHIVCIAVDCRNKDAPYIEFYDSKGLTSQDRKGQAMLNLNGYDLPKLLTEINQKLCNGAAKFKENTEKHQGDSHNCGVHVLDYIVQRSKQEDPRSKINPLSPEAANGSRRHEFIQILLQKG